jgi:predicted transcriptional regulator
VTIQARVLKIGIAPREQIQARTMAIARGECQPGKDDPKVWFTSMESLAQVLSTKNALLLELIARSKPTSMRELATLSGREPSNLSRYRHPVPADGSRSCGAAYGATPAS